MDAQRALLDELLGGDRDLAESEKGGRRLPHFSDPEIDKDDLCGCSPRVLFGSLRIAKNYKALRGRRCFEWTKVPSERMKAEWESLPQREKDRYGYEHDLRDALCLLVNNIDRKAAKERARVNETFNERSVRAVAEQLCEIESKAEEHYKAAQMLGEKGLISEALRRAVQAQVMIERDFKTIRDGLILENVQKRLTVCEVSGNLADPRDDDSRLQFHFTGKLYNGMKLVRETLRRLDEKFSYLNSNRNRRGDRRYRSRSRERSRDRRGGGGRRSRDEHEYHDQRRGPDRRDFDRRGYHNQRERGRGRGRHRRNHNRRDDGDRWRRDRYDGGRR